MKKDLKFAFFGTPELAVYVLEELEKKCLLPSVVVTNPDRPVGRKQILTPPAVKAWAETKEIEALQPSSLKNADELDALYNTDWDLFIVAAYGKFIPKALLEVPHKGVLNVHPSLLPKFRGASPVRSAILADARQTGVTIIKLDEEMDHGPIVAQATIELDEADWPPKGRMLDEILFRAGGELLAETIPQWLAEDITPEAQDHSQATFCDKIEKSMGEIDLTDDPYQNFRKIQAFDGWPGTYFWHQKSDGTKQRIKIADASLQNNQLEIQRIIPEGKKEMLFRDFLKQ